MNKKLACLLCCMLCLFICGCEKKTNLDSNKNSKEQINTTEKVEEEFKKQEQNITEDDVENKKENVISSKEKTTTSNEEKKKKTTTEDKKETPQQESNSNKEEINTKEQGKDETSQLPKENKKVVVCTTNEESTKYIGTITHTTTFENDTIVHNKMYVEKHFKEGYNAEEDSWTIDNMNSLKNNTKVGISGNAYIENNTTYLTINYDVKANSKVIEYITSHTEYNDFINHMTTSNGYTCITK